VVRICGTCTKQGTFLSEDPLRWAGGNNFFVYVSNAPVRWVDPWGLMELPSTPGGLPPEWRADPTHLDPNGERFRHPGGDVLDFHKGRPGQEGNKGKDHWHHNKGRSTTSQVMRFLTLSCPLREERTANE